MSAKTPTIAVERLLRFKGTDLHDLCDATETAIRDGGGFGWFSGRRGNPVLTAYGLLEFSDMAKVFPVDPRLIRRTQRWLASQQLGDGSWRGRGRRYRGGFGRPAITAYITWALAESGYKGPALNKALKYLEDQIDGMNDPYRSIVQVSRDFITLIDRNGRYQFANKAYIRALGKDPEDVVGKTVEEILG